jgi:phospholipid transport system substrate-binding protein
MSFASPWVLTIRRFRLLSGCCAAGLVLLLAPGADAASKATPGTVNSTGTATDATFAKTATATGSKDKTTTGSKDKATTGSKDKAATGSKDKATMASKDKATTASKDKKATLAPAAAEAEPTVAAAPSPPPAGSSPMADLKKSNAALKRLFAKSAPSWSPEHDAKRSEMNKIVGGFLDFEELARRALAKHWDGLDRKQRTEFVSVLKELIERNYIKQVHGQPNYELRFAKEEIDGSQATVDATLEAMSKGKKVRVEMQYKLLYKGDRWLVYDVITDEQSMLENYRAEFNKIITKESFEALLKRMKKRLEKTE